MPPDESTAAGRERPAEVASADAILQAIGSVARSVENLTDEVQGLAGGLAQTRGDVRRLAKAHDALRRHVHGSNPPPDSGAPPLSVLAGEAAASADEATAAAGEASGDVAELRGQLFAVRAELAKQSKAMGLGPRRVEWLPSKATIATVVRYATAVAAAYAALHSADPPRVPSSSHVEPSHAQAP